MKFTGERFIPGISVSDELAIEHYQRYYSIINAAKDKIIVDAGTGEGYGAYILAGYAKKVYGIDISKEAVVHAKNRYKKENLEFVESSIENLPFEDNSVDVVVSFETIEHVDENIQRKFLEEVKRVLKDDGLLIISTPDKEIYTDKVNYKNEFHKKEFYEYEFYNFLSRYFDNIDIYYQRFQAASIIYGPNSLSLDILSIESDRQKFYGKYIIAICSNEKIKEINIGSAILDNNERYESKIERILELQKEVEEKNNHIFNLLKEIEKKDNIISDQNKRIKELSDWGNGLDKDLKRKEDLIKEKNHRIEELSRWGKNLDEKLKIKIGVIEEKNQRIEELSSWGKELNEELVRNAELIKEKDIRIAELSSLCDKLDEEIKIKAGIIEEKNQEIQELSSLNEKLDEELQVKTKTIQEKNLKLEEMYNLDENLDQKVKIKDEEIKKINENFEKAKQKIIQLQEELNTKEEKISNLKVHNEQLLEKERHLQNILNSDGWKVLLKYYKFRDFIFPKKSKRKLMAKILFKLIKNPKQVIKNINEQNVKKFFYYLKTEGSERTESRLEAYLEKFNNTQEKSSIQIVDQIESKHKIIFEKSENPLVSIIIPVYNQWEYTYSCLKSIYENTNDISYEIIIADDVSTDETVNINKYIENVNVIRNTENKGFLLNCNNAAKYAKGKYIHFLNNDTNVQKDWLKYLVDLIEKDEKIGIVGSKLIYEDGRLQEAGGIVWNDASGWNYGRLDDPDKPEYNYVKEVDYISGASLMIRKDLWEEIGGFDERYVPAYYEDTDLAFEVRKRGYKVLYQPKSVVVHFEGISHGTDTSSGLKSYQVKNKSKFIEKWKEVLQKDHFENGKEVFYARDKSKDKKTVLVIDHYVPHFDKDAGSRCTYSYLRLFNKMGFKVIFVGDNFYKHEPYTSELQRMGIEVLYGNWYAQNIKKWIEQNGKYIDYAYLNRPHISIKYIDLLKTYTNAKIIYFGHDLHYLRERRNYEIEKNEELLKASERWKKTEFELFNKADVVYVVSSYEEEILKKQFSEKIIRTIPVYIYDDVSDSNVNSFNEREDILFVGGFNHKPNIDAVLWFVKEIFPSIVTENPNIKFYIVGSNPPEEIKKLHSKNIIVTGFVSDEELQKLYNNCRLVVVPLRFGAGVKGKVVEAMYYQVPLVTTSIGAEGLKNIEKNLVISDEPKDFAEKVIKLYNDKNLWAELSKNSYNYILNNFTSNSALKIVSKDFK
ncbi:MAG: glycosyltransferase [Clostridiales bacterium]|jgi:GT2 family glycosyltransferase/ubiquinone/menaquinone biosynthesis C-methylase UbiE|nr:glycosyltransferase [Clostridiales bacterium]